MRAEANEQSSSAHLLFSARGRRRWKKLKKDDKECTVGTVLIVVPGDTARDLIIVAKDSHYCIP